MRRLLPHEGWNVPSGVGVQSLIKFSYYLYYPSKSYPDEGEGGLSRALSTSSGVRGCLVRLHGVWETQGLTVSLDEE